MMNEEKNSLEVLFPEEEIEGVKVRPWSLGQSVSLAPTFEKVIAEIKARGIEIDKLEEQIDQLVFAIFPHIIRIIHVTTGIEEKEIECWPISKGTAVVLTIMAQNMNHLKNSFGLTRQVFQKFKATPQVEATG